jgi:hypothetical protein
MKENVVKTNQKPTAETDIVKVTRVVRDETCPSCGWAETFAEANFTKDTPGADAYGCPRCDWRQEAPAAPEPIFYQPVHDEETRGRLGIALARRGYVLTDDEAELDMLSVLVEGDGSLSINCGDLGAGMFHIGEYASVEEYAGVLADWFESDTEDGPAEPGAAEKAARAAELAERAEWIAGMRAVLDLLEAEPEVRLPRIAKEPVKFYVSNALASATIAKHLEGVETADRPGCIFRYETTGRIGSVEVAVYTGAMTGVSE